LELEGGAGKPRCVECDGAAGGNVEELLQPVDRQAEVKVMEV
jgi:hypothetical protein